MVLRKVARTRRNAVGQSVLIVRTKGREGWVVVRLLSRYEEEKSLNWLVEPRKLASKNKDRGEFDCSHTTAIVGDLLFALFSGGRAGADKKESQADII
jgi:hypothetical protein